MVLGLTPVIGIPLPFFSYGGSSLWGFTILLFIFLRIIGEGLVGEVKKKSEQIVDESVHSFFIVSLKS